VRARSIRASLVLSLALSLALALPQAAVGAVSGRHVSIAAPDGVKLAATYWSPGAAGPGAVLLHMCNSSREAWYGLGPKLASRGVHVLALDYRGYGNSGGERRRDDPQEQQRIIDELWPGDVDAAFEFLVAVLRLNVEAHPASANTYDSLAEAYLASGRRDLAREYAQKTLDTLAADANLDPGFRESLRAAAQAKLEQVAAER
jgi:hypothetical protein